MSYSRWSHSDWYTYADVSGGFTVCGVMNNIPTERLRSDMWGVLKEIDEICKSGREGWAPREGYSLAELRSYMLEYLEDEALQEVEGE